MKTSQSRPLRVVVESCPADAGDRDDLLIHFAPLERGRVIEVWHEERIAPGQDRLAAIRGARAKADVIVLMLSPRFLASPEYEDLRPECIARFELNNLNVVPVLLRPCGWASDGFLRRLQPLPINKQPVGKDNDRDADLADIARAIAGLAPAPAISPLERVSISRLPSAGPNFLGRDAEIARLDAAAASSRIRIMPIVGMGGAGKTSLVSHWLGRISQSAYHGARRVFAFSFYSQGSSEERAASAHPFFAAALDFFGDSDPGKVDSFQCADRLVSVLRRTPTLLILDGVEPLQYPPGTYEGELKDRAFRSMLRDLAVENPGFVVITSRAQLADLGEFEGECVESIELHAMPEVDGVRLLRRIGVHGDDDEVRAVVREVKGHALALVLFGNLLVDAYSGDVRRRSELCSIVDDDTKGGHARRVMNAYAQWFGQGAVQTVLRLLGLFDRPAPAEALKALRTEPIMTGLNDSLVKLRKAEWNRAMAKLKKAGLIEKEDGTDGDVDAHPLVREHFGEVLKEENEAAWKEGHRRLYEWYARLPKKDLPDTAEEMEPLYAAVIHGCKAGLWQEAFDELYQKRIRRDNQHYSVWMLGAYSADLSTIASFFEEPWTQPVAALREDVRSWLLNEAGINLRALGRLPDAIEPMRAGLEAHIEQKNWTQAAIGASNLSEIQLALGRIAEAVQSARKSAYWADESGDAFQMTVGRIALADALHQAGQMDDAARLFTEAEKIQRQSQSDPPYRYGLQSYRYYDLLYSRGEVDEMIRRSELFLNWRFPSESLLTLALNHLALGRAYLSRLIVDTTFPHGTTRTHLDEAVRRLRDAGTQHLLPLGLLARAAFFRHIRDFKRAAADLSDALRIATRGSMRLHEADAHLERARLLLDQGSREVARTELDLAKKTVTETGYGRRTPEVKELEEKLAADAAAAYGP